MEQLMGSVFMLVGACAFVYGLIVPRWQVVRASSWPSVDGVVMHSSVGKSSSGTEMFGTTNTFYSARITYQYQIGERRYRNNKIHAGGSLATSLPSVAREQAHRYPQGVEVDVFYNPDKPAESCLERDEQIALFYMAIGAFFVVVGYAFS